MDTWLLASRRVVQLHSPVSRKHPSGNPGPWIKNKLCKVIGNYGERERERERASERASACSREMPLIVWG